jgi:hypothetical protein
MLMIIILMFVSSTSAVERAQAKWQGLLFEAANSRHAHEWSVFKDVRIPDHNIVIPETLMKANNYVEHPELFAERIRALRGHRGPRARHSGNGLRFRPGRAGHRVLEIYVLGRGSRARLSRALGWSLSAVAARRGTTAAR